MAEDRSQSAAEPKWDGLASEGFGKPHGETDGNPPVVKGDSLQGGSMTPEIKGEFGPNKNGVGL